MTKAKITANFTIGDVLEKYPEKSEILSQNLQAVCLGCPSRQIETLAEAAEHHGIEIKKLLDDLNKE